MPKDPEELVVEALAALDRSDAKTALQLADEAAALDAGLSMAHRCRAAALVDLERRDDAEEAFRRALELEADDPELLLDVAEFLLTMRGEDLEKIEEALELAQRGREIAESEDDEELAAELAVVEAMALNTLGDPEGALEALDAAAGELGQRPDLLAERGHALFELLRVPEAKAALEAALKLTPDDPWANHLLGLVLERTGDPAEAERRLAKAQRIAPDEFPAPVRLTSEEFDAAIREAVEQLPDEIREQVTATLVSVKDLPDDHDLRDAAADHPLSPMSLGMFRGPSLRDQAASGELPPQIFLFQRNLERSARSRDELVEQIRITVLHEVGHLLGLSEEDLHGRGLE